MEPRSEYADSETEAQSDRKEFQMCENCKAKMEQAMEEIRQISNGEGPAEAIRETISREEGFADYSEEQREEIYDVVIAQAIAIRAAAYACLTTGDACQEGTLGDPMLVLAMWAGELMSREITEMRTANLLNRLGMGEN